MFYSHEILTNRKYGIATIWLVATLGSKSNTKKLTRKAICDVNLKKACSTISEPEAPMALRLQSNLLYGVVRVYSQQCDYVLQDAQAAQATIRTLFKVSKTSNLDSTASNAKRDQIMVLDDPAFLPELELPPLQDFESLASNFNKSSQRSSQSMMSIDRERGSSVSSMSVAALEFPSSSRNSMLSYQLPNNDPFALSSAHKPIIGEDCGTNDEELLLYDDAAFEFDDEGNLRDISPAEINVRQIDKGVAARNRLSSSAASDRVRADHAIGNFEVPDFGGDDYGIQYGRDEELPDAEPFSQLGAHNEGPFMSGGLQQDDQPLHMNTPDLVSDHPSGKHSSEDPSFESAEAPSKRRRITKKKKNLVDSTLALTNNDLRRFKDNYLATMAASIQHSNVYKAAFQARKNAQHLVFGTGIMGVGNGLGSFSILSPLQSFAGDVLKAKITGTAVPSSLKRNREAEKPNQDSHSPKRARGEDEVGRGYEDEVLLNFDEDMPEEGRSSSGVEMGRDAPSALPDFPSSAMPWNVSASVHSHQRGLSSRKPGSMLSGGRRPMSQSPLIGRGSNLPGNLDHLSLLNDEDTIFYGREDDFQSISGHSQPNFGLPSSSRAVSNPPNPDDFELFGPAAAVDTQTAGTSQWVRQALDNESHNFLEYVRNSVDEKTGDELAGIGTEKPFVTFEQLFEVQMHSKVVAAQAFYHVLTLATRGSVWVSQGREEMGGEIRVGVSV